MTTIISFLLIIYSLFLLVYSFFVMTRNNNSPKKSDTVTNKYCILIPARNESQVIEQLLISIEKQTKKINSKDVYIIVESKEDPTVEIVKKHNMNIIYRKDLTKKRKGYALDDAIKEILSKNKKYDAYFIFDADNILDKNYIKEMINSIEEGYDIGISYRNTKNSSTLVAASSALTFSMINTIGNQLKSKYTNNLTISGTGYYIKGSLVEDWQGFPFNTLTEDYELTLYSTLNNLTTTYNEKAIFYDEQPDSFKVSIKQRTRWVSGYFEARKKYRKSLLKNINFKNKNFASNYNSFIGIYDLIFLLIGLILKMLNHPLLIPLIVYLVLMLLTIYLIHVEKNFKLNTSLYIKTILVHPLLLLSYILCLIKVLTSKEITWDTIEHKETLNK